MRFGNVRLKNTTFRARLQPVQIALGTSAASQNLLKLNYDYGTTQNNGNVLSQQITVQRSNQSPLVFTQSYMYDTLNRLKSAEEKDAANVTTWRQTYTFDRYGNRNFDTANTTTIPKNCGTPPNQIVCPADVPIVNPTINTSNNRLSSTGWQYDAAGNTTNDPEGRTFIYDAENKQKEVRDQYNTVIGQYFFDGDGKRIKKIVPATGEVTIFVYDASNKLVAEYSTEISQDAKTSYLTTDDVGSPRVVTDQFGQVVARHDYMPFGEEVLAGVGGRTSAQGYGGDDEVRQKFTGYERDDESGLDYAQARYFKPNHGRFTSVDPLTASANIKNPQTLNRYTYALNSPYKFTDPLGLEAIQRCWNGICNYYDADEQAASGDEATAVHEVLHGQGQQDDQQSRPYDPQSRSATAEEIETDQSLASIFTDTGIVRGASSARNDPPGGPGGEVTDSHYRFVNGQLHTIHIYGNEGATATAGVYIPKEYSRVRITSEDTVVATNPRTGESIMINHVKVGKKDKKSDTNSTLRKNMTTVRENGTVYIGQIGGRGGGATTDGRGIHSHLVIFPSEKSRSAATDYKRKNWEYSNNVQKHLGDFRRLVRP